jgi:hypothetical protein
MRSTASVLFGVILLSAGFHAAAGGDLPLNTRAIDDFENRVKAYAELHRAAENELPALKQTGSQAEIVNHQSSLAARIRARRQGAMQGNIFSPEISQAFQRLAGTVTQGAAASRVKKSLRRAEPVNLRLKVNDSYPAKVPLQSVPPTLLQNLPKLPPELEYSVVGHALVLRDAAANLIIDFLPNVIP